MRDEALIEPFATQEIFCDGFTNYKVRAGNMSCLGFQLHDDLSQEAARTFKVVVVRLIFPKDCFAAATEEAHRAMALVPVTSSGHWLRKAH